MYYRRKILLALVEAFGGSLSDTDCNKLMFLFGQRTGRHYYDFFPYKYGACSFILYQDKLRLTNLGLLHQGEWFRLNISQSYMKQIAPFDRAALQNLETDLRCLRGQELLRKVYMEYPFFASRSQVAAEILSRDEYEPVRSYQVNQPEPCLFTIGYEGITIDAYLNKLLLNQVHAVIDVRRNPISKKYGFSKSQLQRYLENVEVAYYHIPELGIETKLRQGLSNPEAYQKLFSYYQSHVLPPNSRSSSEALFSLFSSSCSASSLNSLLYVRYFLVSIPFLHFQCTPQTFSVSTESGEAHTIQQIGRTRVYCRSAGRWQMDTNLPYTF